MAKNSAPKHHHSSDRRVQRTITAIHEAFFRLAGQESAGKINVADVAEEANINRKTFYLHYSSIDDLIDELLYEEVSRSSKVLEGAVADDSGNVDVQNLFTTLGAEMLQGFSSRWPVFKHVDSDWILDRLEPVLVKEIVENDTLGLAHILGPHLEYCVSFLCAGLVATYRLWVNEDSELPMEELTSLLTAMVAGGVEGVLIHIEKTGVQKASS